MIDIMLRTIYTSYRGLRLVWVAFLLCLSGMGTLRAELCLGEFQNPPAVARPSALWTWMDGHVDPERISFELEEMKAKGMRGAIIWDIGALIDPDELIPDGPEFLGRESLAMIHHAMDEAGRLGLDLGLIAASSWNSGGTWIPPQHGVRVLSWSEVRVEGPLRYSEVLPLPEGVKGPAADVAVVALGADGAVIDLTGRLKPDGRLDWDVAEGDWRIMRFVWRGTGEELNCPSPNSSGLMIDHLSREATDLHINHMMDRLMEGREDFGSLKLLMLDSYEVKPGLDWTPDFVEQFKERYDYDPVPWLPVLAEVQVGEGDQDERFLHDYHKLVSDLMIENHYGRVRELLNDRGLLLLAEAGHGGYARVEPLKALGAVDIPMGEFWNHRKNWVTKEASSAANIYGKKFVNSESFTGWRNWADGPAAYKRLFDIALCAGLNQVNFHTFAHQPAGSGLPGFAYHAGEHFNVNTTWWDQAGPMLADMARSCYLLQQGRFVADVAVYYGDNAPNLVPPRRIAPTVKPRWGEGHCLHCGRLLPVDLSSLPYGHDYDYVNEEVILERMRVEDGRIVFPDGMNYRMLLLPDREAISPEVLKRIGELVRAGATVVGPKPKRSNSLRNYPKADAQVRRLADRIWGDCDGEAIFEHRYGKGRVISGRPLGEILADKGLRPDLEILDVDNCSRQIDYIHRETAKEDIYLVANTTMEPQQFRARFRVDSSRVPTFWNADSGAVTPCYRYTTGDGYVEVPLELAPATSVFVVFSEEEHMDPVVELQPASSVDILSMDGGQLKARVWEAGSFSLKTASGRVAKASVAHVPSEQTLEGAWRLVFPPAYGAPDSLTLDELFDWTKHPDPGVRFFSGTAAYSKSFQVSEASLQLADVVMLDLGSVKEVAEIKVNGREVGLLWKAPWQINIQPFLKPGANSLEIEVTNVWNNRLVGDVSVEPEDRITKTNLTSKFNEKTPLISSGLLGPVSLRFGVPVTVDLR